MRDRLKGWLIDWQTDWPPHWHWLWVWLWLWMTDRQITDRKTDKDWLTDWLTGTEQRIRCPPSWMNEWMCIYIPHISHSVPRRFTILLEWDRTSAEEICPERSPKFDFGDRANLNFNWKPGGVYETVFSPTWNWREAKKIATDLAVSQDREPR